MTTKITRTSSWKVQGKQKQKWVVLTYIVVVHLHAKLVAFGKEKVIGPSVWEESTWYDHYKPICVQIPVLMINSWVVWGMVLKYWSLSPLIYKMRIIELFLWNSHMVNWIQKTMQLYIKSDVTLPKSMSLLRVFTVTVDSPWMSEHIELKGLTFTNRKRVQAGSHRCTYRAFSVAAVSNQSVLQGFRLTGNHWIGLLKIERALMLHTHSSKKSIYIFNF